MGGGDFNCIIDIGEDTMSKNLNLLAVAYTWLKFITTFTHTSQGAQELILAVMSPMLLNPG